MGLLATVLLTDVRYSDKLEIEVNNTKFWEKEVKKAQILGVLAVAGALGMAMPGEVLAVSGAETLNTNKVAETKQTSKPSIVVLIRATNEAEIAMMEARQAGENNYADYLGGLVEQGIKAQEEYTARTAEDLQELVAALEDGAYVTRLMMKVSEVQTGVTTNNSATIEEPMNLTAEASLTRANETSNAKQAIAKPNQATKIVLAAPKTVATTVKQISAPNTSAGKVVAEATNAKSTIGIAGVLVTAVLALGVGTKIYRKAKHAKD